ncbi:LuxR family transcriptional regulator [Brevibacillus reuszeri]|uniref:Transcriptional regulator n=1 Tax=Brevibacillus reuszeri TaxID=54915 RepID=A0A0K9YJ84_9BACL|nr:LuxR C-terminal-related transcriptional regulator [Brevibacillus reuszeri]KNB68772.1 transcriptional regulator [Brevibacillus reuszeri]MED1859072.1 LuxR C-terminal-related transcriptional regulator [Brevibacillus reuszeri]GED69290.1 LuxR family transcriptional regulator [Brevibacillus reuszeri]
MSTPLLSTKLYVPPRRPKTVLRPRLVERLNEGLHRRLTLVTAPAGFGKTTLVSEWLAECDRPIAWLSLDENDRDPARFLRYVCAALQTIGVRVEADIVGALQAPQPPSMEAILTVLLNQIAASPEYFVLVLDDYHSAQSKSIDQLITFILAHLPPHMHVIITTRKDPDFSLARLRARSQLTELRAPELRFTFAEADAFFREVMSVTLSSEEMALLEARTEGWIAGLQLAALSMQGQEDASSVIQTFSGSHHFVVDYLMEEVLQQQPVSVQSFLLRTSILERMCGPLCDAVLGSTVGEQDGAFASGQEMLESLTHANLFLVPLDHDRRWYRYHHLFVDMLRERLQQSRQAKRTITDESVADLHIRASEWYEVNGLELEAFQHAIAAHDTKRATRLAEGEGMPLLFRGEVFPVMNWLQALPVGELDKRPSLWVMYASGLLMMGQTNDAEHKLKAAELALGGSRQGEENRDVIGHIAAIRATMAVSKHQAETIREESNRAIQYLHSNNLPVRAAAMWTLGYAYQLQGERIAASEAYTEALAISQKIGHTLVSMMARIGLGKVQEAENQLIAAAKMYRLAGALAGNPPLPAASEAYLGLARIYYEWNDLVAARQHGEKAVQLARQLEHTDRGIACEVFLAKQKLAIGEVSAAAVMLDRADRVARKQQFVAQLSSIAEARIVVALRQGNVAVAADLAQRQGLRTGQARVHLAQGDTAAALEILESVRKEVGVQGLESESLKTAVLFAAACYAHGQKHKGASVLKAALAITEPEGFVRTFIDEGFPMAQLLREVAATDGSSEYLCKLLAACEAEWKDDDKKGQQPVESVSSLIEPLSPRELEILELLARGLSNQEISERLFLALSTVKGYNRNLFDKLQVKRRTEAVARARQLGFV